MRRRGRVRKTLYYGSGKVALRRGWEVFLEISKNTVWVYRLAEYDSTARHDLLYTINRDEINPREYLVLIKET